MPYILGVDGGATKTHALVVEETGQALGFGQGGTSNHQVNGLESALTEILRAVNAALDEARLTPDTIETGCFCLAGADLPEDYKTLQPAVERLGLARRVIIKNDTMAALRAGLTRSWGVVVICGTGFNAAGRSPDGDEIRLPGLGFISGDWGGGSALSEEIIRAVMRAWDGRGKPTALTGLVLTALHEASEETLLLKLHHGEITDRELLDLVPLLFEAVWAGDEVAADLVVRMGTEVGVSANALICRLALENEDVEVVLGGSVFKGKGPILVDTVRQVVHRQAPRARILPLRHDPVLGAALLALEASGNPVTREVHHRLASTMPTQLVRSAQRA
jgi:N-acetylglucosamine kinase-like BadF-type ATPase